MRFNPNKGEFPDSIDVSMILKDPPYTIGGVTRKGGFLPEAGITLDPTKVRKVREKK